MSRVRYGGVGARTRSSTTDIVGHAKPAATAGYVKRLGQHPETVARRAAELLDGRDDEGSGEVRNHPAAGGSDAGSNDPELGSGESDPGEQ